MQHDIDCLNFNDKTYSLHKILHPRLESAIMAEPKRAFHSAQGGHQTMATAVYPGSFDPVTKGHLDIIKRAAKINDHLIVAVLNNSAKNPLFTVEERVELLKECCKGIQNVSVESFDGLTVEFAKKRHASVMVRGLRAVTDFENEIQLAQTNHALMPGIETMFLATSIKWSYLSSTIVKEAAYYGSDIGKFVTPNVEKAVNEKYALIRQGKDPEI